MYKKYINLFLAFLVLSVSSSVSAYVGVGSSPVFQSVQKIDAGVSPFSPTDISNLELWLDADDATTITESSGSVSQWDDKSGQGNHATQGTAAKQPTTGTRTQNSKNVIDFDKTGDGENMDLTYASLLATISSDVTVFVVAAKDDSASNFDVFIGGEDSVGANKAFVGQSATTFIWDWGGDNITSIDDDEDPHVFHLVRENGVDIEAYLDGVSQGTASLSSDTLTVLTIGAMEAGGEFDLNGMIAEVIIYTRDLTASEQNQVGNYLSDKWGITWTNLSASAPENLLSTSDAILITTQNGNNIQTR